MALSVAQQEQQRRKRNRRRRRRQRRRPPAGSQPTNQLSSPSGPAIGAGCGFGPPAHPGSGDDGAPRAGILSSWLIRGGVWPRRPRERKSPFPSGRASSSSQVVAAVEITQSGKGGGAGKCGDVSSTLKASGQRLRLKRKRTAVERADSGGSKSSSLHSSLGSKRKQQTVDSNFRQYSKLLTSAAKHQSQAEVELAGGSSKPQQGHNNNQQQQQVSTVNSVRVTTGASASNGASLAAALPPIISSVAESPNLRRVEPICGAMSTPSSRQFFYDLFNRLLQLSSTTAAKVQLRLSDGLQADDEDEESGNRVARRPALGSTSGGPAPGGLDVGGPRCGSTTRPLQHSKLSVSSETPDKKGGKRRKSSSTGVALWQTLSSYALSRTSRSSIGSNQAAGEKRDSTGSSALARTARAEIEQQQQNRKPEPVQTQTQTILGDGLRLGTDQYLSVDMLRKLSLISSHSQVSVTLNGEIEQELMGGDQEPVDQEDARSKSAGLPASAATAGDQPTNRLARPSTATPTTAGAIGSSSTKRHWYRGMVKKILFHSSKPSLKNVVTALELQRRADRLDSEANRAGHPVAPVGQDAQSAVEEAQRGRAGEPPAAGFREIEAAPVATSFWGQRKQSLCVGGSSGGAAPSIHIITSGSSLSLMSATSPTGLDGAQVSVGSEAADRRGGEAESELAISTCDIDDDNDDYRDNKQRHMLTSGREGADFVEKRAENNKLDEQMADDGCQNNAGDSDNRTTGLRSGAETVKQEVEQAGNSEVPADKQSASVLVGGESSASGSLESLTDSVSLTFGVSNKDDSHKLGAEDSARVSAEQVPAASKTMKALANRIVLPMNGSTTALQEPQLCATLRKLSADDCLIINRQRDQIRAQDEEAANEAWILLNRDRLEQSQSACGAVGSADLRADQGDASGEQSASAEGRRQSVKASFEAALHLLVPRPKGSRSASITLGVADNSHKSLSHQFGNSILGAVNVHRTWRDWRQLLGKKKSAGTGADAAAGQAGGAGDKGSQQGGARNEQSGVINGKQSATGGQQPGEPESHSAALGFLSNQSAFARLSSDQQREAAINFDQLMRINQLTLSAANAVMLANLNAQQGPHSGAASSSGANETGSKGSKLADKAAAALFATNELSPDSANDASNPKAGKQGKRSSGHRSHHQPLITRLQSGGNLLLKRSSTKRSSKAGIHGDQQTEPKSFLSPAAFLQDTAALSGQQVVAIASADQAVPQLVQVESSAAQERLIERTVARNPVLAANKSPGGAQTTRAGAEQLVSLRGDNQGDAADARIGGVLDEGVLAAQIAGAAASALERQKRRGEELSLILEPRYDKKQPGAQYPLFASHDLNPILKDLAQLVRKHWKCNYIECSAVSNWNINPIISELTRTLECNQQVSASRGHFSEDDDESDLSSAYDDEDDDYDDDEDFDDDPDDDEDDEEVFDEEGDPSRAIPSEIELANNRSTRSLKRFAAKRALDEDDSGLLGGTIRRLQPKSLMARMLYTGKQRATTGQQEVSGPQKRSRTDTCLSGLGGSLEQQDIGGGRKVRLVEAGRQETAPAGGGDSRSMPPPRVSISLETDSIEVLVAGEQVSAPSSAGGKLGSAKTDSLVNRQAKSAKSNRLASCNAPIPRNEGPSNNSNNNNKNHLHRLQSAPSSSSAQQALSCSIM